MTVTTARRLMAQVRRAAKGYAVEEVRVRDAEGHVLAIAADGTVSEWLNLAADAPARPVRLALWRAILAAAPGWAIRAGSLYDEDGERIGPCDDATAREVAAFLGV